MEWISIKDRLPEENTNVLVADNTSSDVNAISTALLWKGMWKGYDGEVHYCEDRITHWMLLPEPPKD